MVLSREDYHPELDRLGYVAAALLALALLLATSTWYRIEEWTNAPAFFAVLAWQLLTWAPWLFLALIVDRIANRFDLAGSAGRDLAVHSVVAFSLALLHTAWFVLISDWLSPLQEMPDTKYGVFPFFFLFWFQLNLVLYGAIAGMSMSLRYHQRVREREQRAADLELKWAEAQLESLQLQIRPHFLFNTLNTIIVMQQLGKTDAALGTTEALAEILRVLLRSNAEQETTLSRERSLVERYISIEKSRFGDRLDVHWNVDGNIGSALLPSLAMQTLVENAVRIGAGGQDGACCIDIGVGRRGSRLEVRICNPIGDDAEGLGIGLSNTRARLQALYGVEHDLELVHHKDRACVLMSLPYHEEQH